MKDFDVAVEATDCILDNVGKITRMTSTEARQMNGKPNRSATRKQRTVT